MNKELCVLIGDRLAGRVTRRQGAVRFAYDDDYRHSALPTALSVSMPVDIAEHADQTVGPWLAGLLPENDKVLAQWARTFQVAHTPFALLGTPVGEDCAGAVRLVAEDRLEPALSHERAVWNGCPTTTSVTDCEI